MVDPFLPEPARLAAVREALPAVGAGIYLNTGTAGPLPAETAQAMHEAEDWELRVGRASPEGWDDFLERMAEARSALAALLGADPSDIALTHSTTDGMNQATWAIDWRPGDRALTTSLEHPGGLGPLLALRERAGVAIDFLELPDWSDQDALRAALDRSIGPRTRLVSVSHVTWLNGVRMPIESIARAAHERGAWVVVDGAQSVGAIPVDVAASGADFYAFSGQKWLLGPEGCGGLWVSPRVREDARPSFAGYLSFETCLRSGDHQPWADARRFEATTFHRPSVIGLARSVAWLQMYVGLPWVHERGARLALRTADLLADLPGVELLTPRDAMATLVTFRIRGWTPDEARVELGRRVFAITRTILELDALRVSVGFFNSDEELVRFVEAVGELARHTPDSLPRRPALVVLADGETPS